MLHGYNVNIIDIEASGFGPESYPIEIGIVRKNGERFCSLIKPLDSWCHWSAEAEALHGISRALLFKRGMEIKPLCRQINDFLGRTTVYSDALSHDQRWLNKLFYHAQIVPSFTISAIEYLANEEQFSHWDRIKKQVFDEQGQQRHRASIDALVVQQTLRRVQQI